MYVVYVTAVHVAALAVSIGSVVHAGDRPQILIYAFVLECAAQVATVLVVTRTLASPRDMLLKRAAPMVFRLPAAGERSTPLIYEGSTRAVGPVGYLLTIAFLAFLAVVMSHVGAERELHLNVMWLRHDLGWALWLAFVYWAQSLLARTTAIDPAAGWAANVGYHTRPIGILAVAVLVAGLVVVLRQGMQLPASGWTVLGPLFGLRFVYDLLEALPPRRDVVRRT
jgi:hypothetical protein